MTKRTWTLVMMLGRSWVIVQHHVSKPHLSSISCKLFIPLLNKTPPLIIWPMIYCLMQASSFKPVLLFYFFFYNTLNSWEKRFKDSENEYIIYYHRTYIVFIRPLAKIWGYEAILPLRLRKLSECAYSAANFRSSLFKYPPHLVFIKCVWS